VLPSKRGSGLFRPSGWPNIWGFPEGLARDSRGALLRPTFIRAGFGWAESVQILHALPC
jgi:hypothetical protein